MKCAALLGLGSSRSVRPAHEPPMGERLAHLRRHLGERRLAGLLALLREDLRERPRSIAMALADHEFSRARHESRALAHAASEFGLAAVGRAARLMDVALALATAGDPRDLSTALRDLRLSAREAARALSRTVADGSWPEELAA